MAKHEAPPLPVPPPEGIDFGPSADDEVIIYRDFFIVGLRFNVDPALVEILRL
jgi:hypothetical protein